MSTICSADTVEVADRPIYSCLAFEVSLLPAFQGVNATILGASRGIQVIQLLVKSTYCHSSHSKYKNNVIMHDNCITLLPA